MSRAERTPLQQLALNWGISEEQASAVPALLAQHMRASTAAIVAKREAGPACCARPTYCDDCNPEDDGTHEPWEEVDHGLFPVVLYQGEQHLPHGGGEAWELCCPEPEWCDDCAHEGGDPWAVEEGPVRILCDSGRWSALWVGDDR